MRIALGKMWREASEEVRRPYIDRTIQNRAANSESAATFQERLAAWDDKAMAVRRSYVDKHPGVLSAEEELDMWAALGVYAVEQRPKKVTGYAEHSDSDAMDET